jgi:MFS family permease
MTPSPSRQNKFAWLITVMFLAGCVSSYADRAAVGVVMPQIRKDLSLTNLDYGLAMNTFLMAYTILYVLGGGLVDRIGYHWSFTAMISFWSAASVLHALARGLGSLSLFRALLGIGEGGFFPAAVRGASEWFRPEDRAKPMALYLSGVSLGMLLTPPAVGWMSSGYGWRAAFVTMGAAGFLLIPFWLLLHRKIRGAFGGCDPTPAFANRETGDYRKGRESLLPVLKTKKVLACADLSKSHRHNLVFLSILDAGLFSRCSRV